jgi:hypothetical protein
MSLAPALAINSLAAGLLIAGLAYAMSSAARLTPHLPAQPPARPRRRRVTRRPAGVPTIAAQAA